MVSLAEKMAANMDASVFSKATDLKKRLLFTVLALIVFRLGTFIPLRVLIPAYWLRFLPDIQTAFWECLICFPAVRWNV